MSTRKSPTVREIFTNNPIFKLLQTRTVRPDQSYVGSTFDLQCLHCNAIYSDHIKESFAKSKGASSPSLLLFCHNCGKCWDEDRKRIGYKAYRVLWVRGDGVDDPVRNEKIDYLDEEDFELTVERVTPVRKHDIVCGNRNGRTPYSWRAAMEENDKKMAAKKAGGEQAVVVEAGQNPQFPQIKTMTVKIVELKAGQTYYCKETNTTYMCKAD